jgi:hypothetical protein
LSGKDTYCPDIEIGDQWPLVRPKIAREQLMGSRQYHRLESHYLAYQTFYNSSQEVQEAIVPSYTGKNILSYFSNQRNELINRVNNPGGAR